MSDVNITMGVDNTSALQSLKQVENGVNRLAKVFGKLNGATANISIDTSKSMKAINDLQSKLGDIATKITGSIKLDNSDAIKAINEVQSKISGLSTSVNSKVKIDNSAAIQAVNQLQNSIDQLTTGLNASVKIDNNDALNNIKDVYSRLNALNSVTTTRVNIDTTKAEDNLAKLKSENSAIVAMIRQKNKVQVDTIGAEKSMKDLGGAAKTAGGGFSVLGTAIAALGLSTLIQNAGALATTITNLSGSTSIGITSIKSYADAISSAGGDARGAVEDLTDLTRAIDDARKGNSDAQISFAKIGISLSDLSKLSEEDIFKKTVIGLASIQDASKRSTMSMALLGGEMKKVDIQSVARSMATNGSGGADVSSIMASAKAQQAMAKNIANLQSAMLNLLKPLNEIAASVDISIKSFEKFIKIIALLAATIGSLWLFNKFVSLVARVGTAASGVGAVMMSLKNIFLEVGVGIKILGEAFAKGATLGTRFIAIFAGIGVIALRLTNIIGIILTAVQVLDLLLDSFFGFSIIDDTIKYLKNLWNTINGIESAIIAFIKILAGGVSIIDYFIQKITGFSVIDWLDEKVGGIINTIKTLIKFLFVVPVAIDFLLQKISGFSIFDFAAEKLDNMVNGLKKVLNLQAKVGSQSDVRKIDNKIAIDDPKIFAMPDKPKTDTKAIVDAQRGLRLELQKTYDAYRDQNSELSRSMAFQNSLIGLDEKESNKKQKLFDLETNYLNQINGIKKQYTELQRAAAGGTDEEKTAFAVFAGVYQNFLTNITKEYNGQKNEVITLLNEEEKLKAIEQARLDIIQQIVDAEIRRNAVTTATNSAFSDLFSKIRDSKSEIELALLSPLERQREEIRKNARLIEEEMVKKLTEAFTNEEGDIIDPERLGTQIQKARGMITELMNTQMGVLETSQTWSSGWDEAFKEYADSATTAAQQAKNVFQTVTSEMESALSNFVKTGKLNFRDLAASIITSLTSKALTDSFKNLIIAGGNTEYGSMFKSGIGALFGGSTAGTSLSQAAYAGISGYAEGGRPPVGKVSIVGERGPELFVPGTAGTVIPNKMLGGSTAPIQQPIVNNYYNTVTVSAIDSQDASRFLMANKQMIFAANETARRSIPGNQQRK